MSNENNNLTPQQQKELDTVNWRIEFQKKIVEEINSNQNIQDYFKNYTPDSVKKFIEHYAIQKSYWHQHGSLYVKMKEDHDLKWIEAAWWHLELIQQKKLFDIQCLWHAEQIQIPGIELECDFMYWQENILNCSFVDPITVDEVELYQQYLQTDNVQLKDDFELFLSFQNYSQIKEAYLSEDSDYNFPEWYEFYNSRKGTTSYLDLPDIRGKKERFYLDLARSPQQKQAIAEMHHVMFHQKPEDYRSKEGLKILSAFSEETLQFFVNSFEDKQTKEFYKACAWSHRNSQEEEQLQEEIELLLSSPIPIAVEACDDWKEAIHAAARRYTIEMISEHLPEAYEQYQMNLAMNISFPEKNTAHIKAVKEQLVKEILLGRKLNNEPEDLNF